MPSAIGPDLSPGSIDLTAQLLTPKDDPFFPPPLTPPIVTPTGGSLLPPPPPPSLPLSILPLSPSPTDTPTDTPTGSPVFPTTSPTSSPTGTDTSSTLTDSFPPGTTSSNFSLNMSASTNAATSSPSSTPSSGALPVSAASTHHSHHAGAIAGGVIGGVALLVALVGVCLFFRSRHNPIASRIRRKGMGRNGSVSKGTLRKWDGLASRESNVGLPTTHADYGAYHASPPSRQPSSGSTAIMLSKDNVQGYGYYYEDEKTLSPTGPSSSQGHESLEHATPYSQYTFEIPAASVLATPSFAAFPAGRPRERSVSQDRALAFAQPGLNTPRSPTSPGRPYSSYDYNLNRQSLDGRVLASPPTSPASLPQGESIQMNRTSSGAKRMQRKAVPKYDENDFAGTGAAPAATRTSLPSAAPVPASASQIATQDPEGRGSVYYDTRSAGSSSSNLHEGSSTAHGGSAAHDGLQTVRSTRSREELIAAGYKIPKLSEKASFGDMQNIHYLIPDFPPPQVA